MHMKLIVSLIHLLLKYLLTCERAEQDTQGVFTGSHMTSAFRTHNYYWQDKRRPQ